MHTFVLTARQIFINNLTNKVSWAGFSLTHLNFLNANVCDLHHEITGMIHKAEMGNNRLFVESHKKGQESVPALA